MKKRTLMLLVVMAGCGAVEQDGEVGSAALPAAADRDTSTRWEDGLIRYVVDTEGTWGIRCASDPGGWVAGRPGVDGVEEANIEIALNRYRAFTPLTFPTRLLEPPGVGPYLIFTKGDAAAHTGSKTAGGIQCVYLKKGASTTEDAVQHEVGHVIGMDHEQRRYDREDYIHYDGTCITAEHEHRYEVIDPSEQILLGPYDTDSIMHYGSKCDATGPCVGGAGDNSCCDAAGTTCYPALQRRCDPGDSYCLDHPDVRVPCDPTDLDCQAARKIDDNDDFSKEDINAIHRMYERPLGDNVLPARFGAVMVSGDFDGDSYMDLAVGAPDKVLDGHATGAVYLFKGTSARLVAWKVLHSAAPADGGRFGASLAAGDFDGDGVLDLAVGAPGERGGAGAVHLFRVTTVSTGTPLRTRRYGLDHWGDPITQVSLGGSEAAGDELGAALAAGDFNGPFNGTHVADLAIGIPGKALPGEAHGGVVQVLRGRIGDTPVLWRTRSAADAGLGSNNEGNRYGESLLAVDFNTDGLTDLVVGAPMYASSLYASGAAFLYLGGASLAGQQKLLWSASAISPSRVRFGAALAAGRFTPTLYGSSLTPGLAVGAPDVSNPSQSGRIYIYTWNASTAQLSRVQTLAHPSGTALAGDQLGGVLAALRLGGAATDTLVAGVPLRGAADRGAIVKYFPALGGAFQAEGALIEDPLISTTDHFGSSIAAVDTYDAMTGERAGNRLVVGADVQFGAGAINLSITSPLPPFSNAWQPMDQEWATPE